MEKVNFAKPGQLPHFAKNQKANAIENQTTKVTNNAPALFPLLWSDDKRAVPSSILRSALFGIAKKGRRELQENKIIPAWKGCQIKYSGVALQQSEQDVFMAVIEACKRANSTTVIISQRELIRLAGRKGGDTKRMWRDLLRLCGAVICIDDGTRRYAGSLIQDVSEDDETHQTCITINPKILVIFGGGCTHIEMKQRHALKTNFAKWLHGYALTHASHWKKPHKIRLTLLQETCGSSSSIREFRRSTKLAMDALKECGVIGGWILNDDVLTLWKSSK